MLQHVDHLKTPTFVVRQSRSSGLHKLSVIDRLARRISNKKLLQFKKRFPKTFTKTLVWHITFV